MPGDAGQGQQSAIGSWPKESGVITRALPRGPSAVVPAAAAWHIIARQHAGPTTLANLALDCHHDNLHKGPNLTGIDPVRRKLVRLFHPRRMKWARHFRWDGPVLVGRTPLRRALIDEGVRASDEHFLALQKEPAEALVEGVILVERQDVTIL